MGKQRRGTGQALGPARRGLSPNAARLRAVPPAVGRYLCRVYPGRGLPEGDRRRDSSRDRSSMLCGSGPRRSSNGAVMTYRVVLLPGDGIGPEVVGAAVRVLD